MNMKQNQQKYPQQINLMNQNQNNINNNEKNQQNQQYPNANMIGSNYSNPNNNSNKNIDELSNELRNLNLDENNPYNQVPNIQNQNEPIKEDESSQPKIDNQKIDNFFKIDDRIKNFDNDNVFMSVTQSIPYDPNAENNIQENNNKEEDKKVPKIENNPPKDEEKKYTYTGVTPILFDIDNNAGNKKENPEKNNEDPRDFFDDINESETIIQPKKKRSNDENIFDNLNEFETVIHPNKNQNQPNKTDNKNPQQEENRNLPSLDDFISSGPSQNNQNRDEEYYKDDDTNSFQLLRSQRKPQSDNNNDNKDNNNNLVNNNNNIENNERENIINNQQSIKKNEEINFEELGKQFDDRDVNFENVSLPAQSILDSVQISEELPNNIHEHNLDHNNSTEDDICTICLNKKSFFNSYICNLCPLKICGECAKQININSFSKNKHEHELCIVSEGNSHCYKCNKEITPQTFYFHCERCNFDICLKCYYPSRKEEPKKDEKENAIHPHPWKKYNDLLIINCSLCEKEKSQKVGYKCDNCRLELCEECAIKVYKGRKREGLHEHHLFLMFRDVWECQVCEGNFRKKASFYCSKCEVDYCDECFIEKNSE
jgi:hypothetical protein